MLLVLCKARAEESRFSEYAVFVQSRKFRLVDGSFSLEEEVELSLSSLMCENIQSYAATADRIGCVPVESRVRVRTE